MSDQHPTPQWYAPRGGAATDTSPYGGPAQPTAPIPPVPSSTVPPPPGGPFGPSGPSGSQGSPAPRSGRRRTAELTAVAVLAALLSSGGTIAAARLFPVDAQSPSAASTTQLGRGADTAPVVQADASAPDWSTTAAAVSPSVVSITATAVSSAVRRRPDRGAGEPCDPDGPVGPNGPPGGGGTVLDGTVGMAAVGWAGEP